MKLRPILLASLLVLGCRDELTTPLRVDPPTPPGPEPPPPDPSPRIWGMVVDRSGGCLGGALVRVVTGEDLGPPITQQVPCSIWEDDGGFLITGLTGVLAVTLRASAPGYAERQDTLEVGVGQVQFIQLEPLPPH